MTGIGWRKAGGLRQWEGEAGSGGGRWWWWTVVVVVGSGTDSSCHRQEAAGRRATPPTTTCYHRPAYRPEYGGRGRRRATHHHHGWRYTDIVFLKEETDLTGRPMPTVVVGDLGRRQEPGYLPPQVTAGNYRFWPSTTWEEGEGRMEKTIPTYYTGGLHGIPTDGRETHCLWKEDGEESLPACLPPPRQGGKLGSTR